MLILGIDFETTGLDASQDIVLQYGFALYDTNLKKIVRLESGLVNPWAGAKPFFLDPDSVASQTHGLTEKMLREHGFHEDTMWSLLEEFSHASHALLGHNVRGFDRKFVESYGHKNKLFPKALELPVIDTTTDIEYPKTYKMKNLVYLCAEAGFLNPFPHQALFDIVSTFRLFEHYSSQWPEIFRTMYEPILTVDVNVPFEKKDYFKAKGLYWSPERKTWFITGKKSKIERLISEGFFEGLPLECTGSDFIS